MAEMTDDQIKGLLVREIRSARAHDDTELRAKRLRALEYYNGEMKDTPAEAGRSSVVSRDVSDTIGWMLPGIMRVFTASEHMAIAEPVGEEDEELATQQTDGLNHIFWKDNPGYKILYDATHDSLLLGNGIVKVWNDDTPEYVTSFHSGLSLEQKMLLEQDEDVEITHETATEEMAVVADEMGQPVEVPVEVFEVKVKRLKSKSRRRVEVIPPEDFLIDQNATTIADARMVGHKSRRTRSDLVAMGHPADKVKAINVEGNDTAEDSARSLAFGNDDAADPSMEEVEYVEAYMRLDVDGDGIAETVFCQFGGGEEGGELLSWEVWEDEQVFYDIPCDPLPHRFDARSIADETMDVQRVKTVLLRQTLDNTYATNNPQRFVKGKLTNPEELFSPSFGGVVFGEANSEIRDLPVPFVANHSYDALGYQDEIIQKRTGVGRQTMALDPEALQNQTATASQNQRDAAYSQVELVARNMAELGWKPIFRALMKLEIKHQDRPRTIRMRNRAVQVDPRSWNADFDVTINVGLGTGSRDRDMMMLESVLQKQVMLVDRLGEGGFPDKALEMLPLIHNTLTKQAESAGLRNPDAYFPDVTPEDIEAGKQRLQDMAQQPDPAVAAEKERASLDFQAKDAQAQRDHEYRMAQAAAKRDSDIEGIRAKLELDKFQTGGELDLKRRQLVDELALKRDLGFAQLNLKRELGTGGGGGISADVASGVQMGGDPG